METKRSKRCLELIEKGLTSKEIAKELGYKKASDVTDLARLHGVKAVKDSDRRKLRIRSLRLQGKTYQEIANAVGMSVDRVSVILCKQGLGFQTEKRRCSWCGQEFETNRPTKIYCSVKCQRKAGRHKESNDDTHVNDMIHRYTDEWDYVRGFTNSDGKVIVKHRVCGHETEKSLITIRRKDRQNICPYCEGKRLKEIEREKEDKRKAERAKRITNLKSRLKKLRAGYVCVVCGVKFYGNTLRQYCPTCAKEVQRHKDNMRKRNRYKMAYTPESKTISLKKLYERDKGVCWLCGGVCDLSLDTNDNYYPSIDHVVPITKGGKDEWSNIKLAHRICNSLKSDKEPVGLSPYRIFFERF